MLAGGVWSLTPFVDTSIILAAADDADPDHERCPVGS
jgi:hypothetical protein